jgi:HEAT repeat protein
LNKIGDTGIIDELIKMVQGTNQTLRITATMLLGKLGDIKTPGHLVDLLDGKSEVASSAAKALDNLKWKPPKDARGARYYILLRKWNECLDIGEPAVDPLIECMINKSGGNEIDAAGILGKLNNQKAVKPLISMLNNPRKEARIAAARALINLYQSGCLDEKSQALILNNKEIIQTHKDGPITQGGSDCHSEVVGHGDSGIGVTFPV